MNKNDKLQLNVDIHSLINNEKTIKNGTEIIRKKIEFLKNSLDELNSFWMGKAADAFSKNFNNDIAELEELLLVSRWLSEIYSFALSSYMKSEQKASDIVNAINI